jgi:hypothetical protein
MVQLSIGLLPLRPIEFAVICSRRRWGDRTAAQRTDNRVEHHSARISTTTGFIARWMWRRMGSGWCRAGGSLGIERDCRSNCERGLNEPGPRPRRTWPLICESRQLANYWQHRHIHRQFLCDGEDRPCWHHCRRRSGDKDRQLLPSRTCVGGHTLGPPQDLTAHHQKSEIEHGWISIAWWRSLVPRSSARLLR